MYQEANVYTEGSQGDSAGEKTASAPAAVIENQRFIASDGTAVTEISLCDNTRFSEEIIRDARRCYSLENLRALKADEKAYLREGFKQIDKLCHGIHGLTIHTEMYTVFFLIAVGKILEEIKSSFERLHEFTKWRDTTFGNGHRRYFQAAVQLANMGDFSSRYAPMGKTRLLQLEAIRKKEGKASCEEILQECPEYRIVERAALPDDVIKRMDAEPFPDISHDFDGERAKQYVSSVITQRRLSSAGIPGVDFDKAQLVVEYYGEAIPVKDAQRLSSQLKGTVEERQQSFDNLLMDRMKQKQATTREYRPRDSLNKVLADVIRYFNGKDLENEEWLARQKEVVDARSLIAAREYLKRIAEKLDIIAIEGTGASGGNVQ